MSKHVVVIGGGVVGLCVAYYARRRGFEVTVVEREGAERSGTSYGNAGLIVPSHFVPLAAPGAVPQALRWMVNPESPFYVRPRLDLDLLLWGWRFWRSATPAHVQRSGPLLRDLHTASRRGYEELAEAFGNPFHLEQKGLLMLCHSEHGLEEEAKTAERARDLGIAARVLGKAEAETLEPGVTMDIVGAVHFPEDAHLDPSRFMSAVQAWLEGNGVTFEWRTRVLGWRREGRTIAAVRTSAGEIPADEVVLAAGLWSEELARDVKLELPMQAGKGYSMTLSGSPQPFSTPAILSEARVSVTPLGAPDGKTSVRFGGTMEIAGVQQVVNPRRVEGIIKSVVRYFPAYTPAHFEDVPVWYGFRPCTPDGLPYIGRAGTVDNLVTATGHAMMGLSLAPITGSLVGDLLAGEAPSVPLDGLSPGRFSS